jgi:flagellar hook-associated protein 1 FlgK
MPGITDALISTANHMNGLERALALIQTNVSNASTPGYARQDLVGIDSASAAGSLLPRSSRDEYAEAAVRQHNSLLGRYDQLASTLQRIEPAFAPSADAGVPKAISALFASFSALTASPNDTHARQIVLDRAGQLGRAFNSAGSTLREIAGATRRDVTASVDRINQLAGLVADFNVRQANSVSSSSQSSVDTKLHETLEQLSEFADVQLLEQNDGSLTLLLGGQTALVVGKDFYPISADLSSGPSAVIRDSGGVDITSQVSGGRLGGALVAANQLLPSFQSSLDQLAQGIADTVNNTLAAGIDANGNPGAALFTYDALDPARTLAATGIGTAELAAALPGAPGGAGNAQALAALESAPLLNGLTFAGHYGGLVSSIGRNTADALDNLDVQKQLVTQARAQRTELSGVSLDEQAVRLIEYQRAYQATAKMFTILNELTETTLHMIP